MRKMLLATAVALAPLTFAAAAGAQATISSSVSTPVKTSTANNGAPSDVVIASGGSVNVTTGAAVTRDSNNQVTNQGAITMQSLTTDGQTGIQINPGTITSGTDTFSVLNSGTISLTDTLTQTDTNKNGLVEGPFANGSGRYGIHALGAFGGDVSNTSTGTITVHGENSYGIALDGLLTGNFSNLGAITLYSDTTSTASVAGHAAAIQLSGVTGAVTIGGTLTVRGGALDASNVSCAPGTCAPGAAGPSGVIINGPVSGGRVTFDGSISTTGYALTTRPNATLTATLLPAEKLQDGPSVIIAANLAHGALFDSPPVASTTNPDVDGDGVPDTSQTASSIAQYGSAPALQIGSTTQNITLGVVGTTVAASAPDYNYGLILKGSILANGIFDGVNATGVEIGATTRDPNLNTVTVQGGARVTGKIAAIAYQANATGMDIGSSSVPVLRNEGSITATGFSNVTTPVALNAIAVLLEPGASVTTLTNSGTITAGISGIVGIAAGVVDRSGTLADIENRGTIATAVAPDPSDPNTTPADEAMGRTGVAIDVGCNTAHQGACTVNSTGVMVHSYQAASTDPVPAIAGSIYFGTGADTLQVDAGTVNSPTINFNTATSGYDNLIVNGGTVTGSVFTGDGRLNIAVNGGTLTQQNGAQLHINNLSVGSAGTLIETLDPTGGQTGLSVAGTATLASGSNLGVRLASLLTGTAAQQLTVIQTAPGQLNIAAGANLNATQSNAPYLFQITPMTDQVAQGRLYVVAQRRTAASLGLNPGQAGAYDAIYQALGSAGASATSLRGAVLAETTQSGFLSLYNQLLPEHSGAQLFSLASGVDAVSRALGDRRTPAAQGDTSGWIQEIDFYAKSKPTDATGFKSNGFGVASGVERGGALGALGASLAFTSSDQKDPYSQGDTRLTADLVELGVYWRAQGAHWRAWTRAAGGYAWFTGTRQFVDFPNAPLASNSVLLTTKANWNGYTGTVGGGFSYEQSFGRYFVRPEFDAEYFYLNEASHTETGGGVGFDQALGSRSGHLGSATAMLNFGGRFGAGGWIQPEFHVGYRDFFAVDAGTTTGTFANVVNAVPFNVASGDLNGGGPVVGFRLVGSGEMGFLALEGDADLMKMYRRYQIMLRAAYRF